MKNTLIISNKYKVLGWFIFLIFAVLGLACIYAEFEIPGFEIFKNTGNENFIDLDEYNLTNELAIAGTIIGLLLISFSAAKQEDEYVASIRLKCWQWSVLISYLILMIINLTVYGSGFYIFLIYNMFTVLIVFIAKFEYSLYKLRKDLSDSNNN